MCYFFTNQENLIVFFVKDQFYCICYADLILYFTKSPPTLRLGSRKVDKKDQGLPLTSLDLSLF